jgi:ubiquinone/menaquinone biosynthesis C-methylase UbiE
MNNRPTGAGKSSFDLLDAGKLFSELQLRPGDVFLDLGSGVGPYALAASDYVTDEGMIYAVDLWKEGIESLRSEVEARGIDHIYPQLADIGKRIPLEDATVDVGLMSTVLHDLVRDGAHQAALREVERVLKPGGKLAVVEFKRVGGPPGPPLEVRLSPGQVEALLGPRGFELARTLEVGPYHYLSIFLLARRESHQE